MALTSLFCIDPAAFPGLISATKNEVGVCVCVSVCVSACVRACAHKGGGIGHQNVCVSPTSCESDRNEKKEEGQGAAPAIRDEGQQKAWGGTQMQVFGRF